MSEDFISTDKKRKLKHYGIIIKANNLFTAILGKERRGRQGKNDLISSVRGLDVQSQAQTLVHNRNIWMEPVGCIATLRTQLVIGLIMMDFSVSPEKS